MRLIFVVTLAFFTPFLCEAQELTAVTNMAGFDGVQEGSVVTMSIGEPAITTLMQSSGMITQGFLQPEILPCQNIEFSYYPNPATTELTLEANGCEGQVESLQLLNLWGQVITTTKLGKDNKVTLEGLSQAVYIIKVYLTTGITKTIKIVKVVP